MAADPQAAGGAGRCAGVTLTRTDPDQAALDGVVDGLRARDPDAFRACYELTSRLLISVAYALMGNRVDAEDAAQDAYLALVRAAPELRGDGRSLRAWLVRATRNAAIDRLRARGRRPEQLRADLSAPDSSRGVLVGPDDVPEAEMPLDPEMLAALDLLTTDQRSVLVLRHVVGLSGGEVAQVLGISRAAVYALCARAERAMRTTLSGARSRRLDPSESPAAERPVGGSAHDRVAQVGAVQVGAGDG